MSSETRTFRPVTVDERLAGIFDRAVLNFGSLPCVPGGSILVDDGTFASRKPILVWTSEEGFEDFRRGLHNGAIGMGLAPSLLCLAVTARSGPLKLHELTYRRLLSQMQELDRAVPLGDRPDGSRRDVFCLDTHGVTVDAWVALADGVRRSDDKPLRPWRVGTWLARATFQINCHSGAQLFRPQPLDDERRRYLRLDKDSVRYVELEDVSLDEPIEASDAPVFWVDEQLLNELSDRRGSAVARYLQLQLAVDFIAAAVQQYAGVQHDRRLAYDEVKDSLIGRIVRFVAGSGATDERRDQILRMCRDEPRRVIALAEHAAGVRPSMLKSLETNTT